MPDFIPQSDAEFNLWQASLVTLVQTNTTAWGILAADVTLLVALQTTWTAAFAKTSNKQNRTSADVQAKDDAREAYEKGLRKFIAQWLANNTKVTNSDRGRMGLTVKSGTRTPTTAPMTFPVGTIDFSVRLRHTISFIDEATPLSKAKPEGIYGCEVWAKIGGDAPKNASELMNIGTCTRTPFIYSFDGTDAGKTVYYWLRWINTKGQHGPWSSAISAMVMG